MNNKTVKKNIYSATKKKEILSFAAKWMGLEDMVLIKIGQTENKKYCLFSFTCEVKTLPRMQSSDYYSL
jgi:hypothetical protein